MPQSDLILDNLTFPSGRADINNAIAALASCNSGGGQPVTTHPYMLWADTANNQLKQRNGDNNAWIVIGALGQAYWGNKVTAQDDANTLTDKLEVVNFTGAGVTATNAGNTVTVTIPGGGEAGGSSDSFALNLTALKNLPTTPYKVAFKAGRTNPGDLGHGFYHWADNDATAADDATIIASNVSVGRWRHVWMGEVFPELFGALGNGTTNDAAAWQAAINYCFNQGGGYVKGRPAATYLVNGTGETGSEQLSIYARVSIDGQGCKFVSTSALRFMSNRVQPGGGDSMGATNLINADVTEGQNTLTLNAVQDLAVGDEVFVRLGQFPDPIESRHWFYANITAMAGNTITLDRVMNFPLTVSAISNDNNRSVRRVNNPGIPRNVFFKNFDYTNSNANAVLFFYAWRARDIAFENISVRGVQFCYLQYVDEVKIHQCSSYDPHYTEPSTGRCLGFAECKNISIDTFYGQNFQIFTYVEFGSTNINYNNIHMTVGTAWQKTGHRYLFFCGNESRIHVSNLLVYGEGNWNLSEDSDGVGYASFTDMEFRTSTRPRSVGPQTMSGLLMYQNPTMEAGGINNCLRLDQAEWFWTRIQITNNMNAFVVLPQGQLVGNMLYYASDETIISEITQVYISRAGQVDTTGRKLIDTADATKNLLVPGKMKRQSANFSTDDGTSGVLTTNIQTRIRVRVVTGTVSSTNLSNKFIVVGANIAFATPQSWASESIIPTADAKRMWGTAG